jgi:hypothetical protein
MGLIKTSELPTPKTLEKLFLKVMGRLGYATDDPAGLRAIKPHPVLEGWKIVEVAVPFGMYLIRIRDQWGKSGGFTTIDLINVFGNELPLWRMDYWGSYEDDAIPVLKAGLAAAYTNEQFIGGRGVPIHPSPSGDMNYYNQPDMGSDFNRFSGMEGVLKRVPSETHRTHRGETCL